MDFILLVQYPTIIVIISWFKYAMSMWKINLLHFPHYKKLKDYIILKSGNYFQTVTNIRANNKFNVSTLLTSNKVIGEYSWFAWNRQYTQYEIWGSHGGGYEDYCCVQCDAM
jgi:hypothetical protein